MLLQSILLPNDEIRTDFDLYFQIDGVGAFSDMDESIHTSEFSTLRFDTFFNFFNIAKWDADCHLNGLFLDLECAGKFEVRVVHTMRGQNEDVLHSDITTFAAGQPERIDLSHYKDSAGLGLIHVELRAWSAGARFIRGAFSTDAKAKNDLSLAICITTFKREQEVQETARRLDAFLSTESYGDNMHVYIVDNGQSAEIAQTAHITPIDNPNYGGAGGFTRGLIEARDKGFSHCLFMDDDATFHMENLRRTFAYLSLAKDSRTAMSSAMISNANKSAMWEYGAHFEGTCRPQFVGADLRDSNVVRQMEMATTRPPHPNSYGAWWYFAFPIAQARHLAFPFFVRGDDINFSLANDFKICKINGVVSFQDDFQEKESPQTLYLEVRNHVIQCLVIDRLERSHAQLSKLVGWFVARRIANFHYDTAEAILLAFEDVMKGPAFFRDNLDMSQRRADIKAFTRNEVWQPISDSSCFNLPEATEFRPSFGLSVAARKRLYAYTLNATLLPLQTKSAAVRLSIERRGLLDPIWGAKTIHVISTDEEQSYVVSRGSQTRTRIAQAPAETVFGFQARFRSDQDRLS